MRARRGEGSAPPKASLRQAAVNYRCSRISQDQETECARPISPTSCPISRAGSTWVRPVSYRSGFLSIEKAGTKAHLPRATALRWLVYFETYSRPSDALAREKEIKGWRREKKLRLVLKANPDWADLSAEWKEDESWQAIPEAKSRPVLRPRRGQV